MPDKKLTDNEIVKALKDTLHRIKGAEHLIVPKEGVENLCNGLQNALDLINRLQAENERLNSCVKSEDEVRKIAKRTMEPLVKEITKEQIDIAVKLAKAEVYKECIEKVKDLFPKEDWFTREALDNLLKELVGDNNES